jgi:hypothetical protein
MSEHDNMRPLAEIISGLFSGGHLPFTREDCRIWKIWSDAVGPIISRAASPSWIRNGRLRVCVSDPIWLTELGFLEGEIRKKLNTLLGQERIQKIEFRLAGETGHHPGRTKGVRSQAPFGPRNKPRSRPAWPRTEGPDK